MVKTMRTEVLGEGLALDLSVDRTPSSCGMSSLHFPILDLTSLRYAVLEE